MSLAEFSASQGLIGGALIGLAAVVLMGIHGRIAGISGILGGLFTPTENLQWQVPFIGGLFGMGLIYSLLVSPLPIVLDAGWPRLILAGLLVGLGTRLGNGCTSGHGVCGLARGSRRSLVATVIFMLSAIITVWIVK